MSEVKVDVDYTCEADGAVFCTFEWECPGSAMSGTTAAVVYADGTCYTCRDWQSPNYPHIVDDIEEYDWRDFANGKDAIVLNGLPRVL